VAAGARSNSDMDDDIPFWCGWCRSWGRSW